MNTPREVLLYSRPGCHLCEHAAAQLAQLQGRFPHLLRIVDITSSPDLVARYGHAIPVVAVAGREYAAPLSAALLAAALDTPRG